MPLSDKLKNPPARTHGIKPVMDVWFDTLTPEDQEVVKAALRNADWRHTDLQEALIAEGAPTVADTTFGAWRRRNAR